MGRIREGYPEKKPPSICVGCGTTIAFARGAKRCKPCSAGRESLLRAQRQNEANARKRAAHAQGGG